MAIAKYLDAKNATGRNAFVHGLSVLWFYELLWLADFYRPDGRHFLRSEIAIMRAFGGVAQQGAAVYSLRFRIRCRLGSNVMDMGVRDSCRFRGSAP